MTGEVINLRLARKARDRARAAGEAAASRAKHGQTRGERQRREAEAERLSRIVDGAKQDDD